MIPGVSYHTLVHRIAAELGIPAPEDSAVEHVLWEHTAWPVCTDVKVIEPQIRKALTEGCGA